MLDGGVQRVFYGLLEEDLGAFCPVFEGWQLGSGGFGDVIIHCLPAF